MSPSDIDAFKTKLVEDVFGKDNKGKVPVDKVMILIWQFRDDPSVVQFMAQFVTKYAGRRDVFDGIEFYLPQLAHMIIHLEANWDDAVLERLALIIAMHSIHFALQLNWILQGAMEDYQPELPSGEPNPKSNPLFYVRCVKILANIERCVVYGSPRSVEFQRMYEKGEITKDEYQKMSQADKAHNATLMTTDKTSATNSNHSAADDKPNTFGGTLLYKRHVRTSHCKPKRWKTRYFTLSDRILYCYNREPSLGGRLIRAMQLDGAIINFTPEKDAKYPFMFDVQNLNHRFRIRASTEEERAKWMQELEAERDSHTLYPHQTQSNPNNSNNNDNNTANMQIIKDLTPSQKQRYEFFQNERNFVQSLTNLAEELRFHDREERKRLAPGLVENLTIPSDVYAPLCNSTDVWRRLHASLPNHTRVFSTRERCPVILFYLARRGEEIQTHKGLMKNVNLDIAEYIHLKYEDASSTKSSSTGGGTKSSGMETIQESDSIDVNATDDQVTHEVDLNTNESTNLWLEHHDHNPTTTTADASANISSKGSSDSTTNKKGNAMFRSMLRDNLVRVPSKIKTRLPSSRSVLNKSHLQLEPVPILDHENAEGDDDELSIRSELSGSIMTTSSQVVRVDHEEDGIDEESLVRAKNIIWGGQTWADKSKKILLEAHEQQLFDNNASTEVYALMSKSNDDLRQEVFVMQMIHFYKSVFAKASLPIWLKTYRILSTSKTTGLLEYLVDSNSIDGLKKSEDYPKEGGMLAYFVKVYGPQEGSVFKAAQRNFMRSLCGYSLVSYLLGLKDRHNGNIMIDIRGHLTHIDFGFAMGMAPGHEFSMERAPFKLTQDYIDVMGGLQSQCFKEFQRLFVSGFEAARSNSQIALGLVEIMMYKSNYPCFSGSRYGGNKAIKGFQSRLMLNVPDSQVRDKAKGLITKSVNHKGTWLYDRFQLYSNGYAM